MSIDIKKLKFLVDALKKVLPDIIIGTGLKIKHEFTLEELSNICENYRDSDPIFIQSSDPFKNPFSPIKTDIVMMYGCPINTITNTDTSHNVSTNNSSASQIENTPVKK